MPPEPGLNGLTGPVEDGRRIAGEEWLISPAGLGRFLADLPARMALGQVTLSDGRQATGFTCQPAAVEGAEDISAFGGWRAYVSQGE